MSEPLSSGRKVHVVGDLQRREPGIERRHGPSMLGQVSFTQPATAASSLSTARRAGTWQLQPCRSSSAATLCTV
ncbi:hypothetical protein [Streptomyces himalayensis]|uniref:hypothetical protein n=1 Tax=Streptomyces himalayensis TaxID=2820085 RepID=UPI001FE55E81|nr:hypothetical protein [Streptomyces himalayensis]